MLTPILQNLILIEIIDHDQHITSVEWFWSHKIYILLIMSRTILYCYHHTFQAKSILIFIRSDRLNGFYFFTYFISINSYYKILFERLFSFTPCTCLKYLQSFVIVSLNRSSVHKSTSYTIQRCIVIWNWHFLTKVIFGSYKILLTRLNDASSNLQS